MSLWTPGGEHQVPRENPGEAPASDAPGGPAAPPAAGGGPDELLSRLSPEDRAALEAMGPEERARAEAMIREMAAAQAQMAETPAAVIVANHAMGLYELATIHLRQSPPNFPEAQIAIDSFAALVESLKGRLGPDEATLGDALTQIRMAFVQLRGSAEPTDDPS